MRLEKIVFAALACVLLAGLAFIASSMAPRQPVAFFAYGANLAKGTMSARAGGFLNATPADLPGYSLVFASLDARPAQYGVANIVQAEGNASVPGALYYLTQEQMAALDKYAGVPNFYQRREFEAFSGGKAVGAQAYFLVGSTHLAAPTRLYLTSVINGAKEFGYGTSDIERAALDASKEN